LAKTLFTFRYGIPAALVAFGLGCAIFMDWPEGAEAFSLFAGAGLSILLLNVLYRMGVRGDFERDEEEAARTHFSEHGKWPEDRPGAKRKWHLPEGVQTLEDEERQKRERRP
jgi:hypothetical protein